MANYNYMSIFVENKKSEKTWGEIIFDFFDYAKEKFEIEMRRRRNEALKKIISLALFLLGLIYFLNGFVELISKLFDGAQWLGSMIIGFILGVIGFALIKNN
ncbi:MAG: hypothetical protein ACD_5C00119G0003 [uncultured bacterium]|nr:MAG: hypothetical protein ACD_5C00119G0003 [uncultured bacterium]